MNIVDDENKKANDTEMYNRWEENHRKGKIMGGLIIVGIGCLIFAREMGVYIPHWIFSWPTLLIVIGFYVGVKSAFQQMGWFVMVLLGTAFLIKNYMPEYNISHYMFPVALIIVGVFIILKPKGSHRAHWNRWHKGREQWQQQRQAEGYTSTVDDFLEVNAVFGGVKKNVISKNFRGGEMNCVFGGGEINLMQADINGTVELEVNAVFGGARLIVPSHWEVKSDLTAVLGNVEDKRPLYKDAFSDAGKVLVLRGAAVFGGIEIRSY